jgi:hypothetical protein
MCTDITGNVYFTDLNNSCVRKVNTSGIISTIAGNGDASYCGDGGPASAAELYYAWDVKMDPLGNMFIADSYNNRIRKINTSGSISTIGGDGYLNGGYTGDGGPATDAELDYPSSICLDTYGNVYFSDQGNQIVREIVYPIATSVETIQNTADISVFPNPSSGRISFNISGVNSQLFIEIYSVTGQRVYSTSFSTFNSQLSIDLTGQASGIYLYRVITENGALLGSGKLIVQR